MAMIYAQSLATLATLGVTMGVWYRRRVASIRTAPRDALLCVSLLILASYAIWAVAAPTAQAWGQLSLMTLYVAAGWAAYHHKIAARRVMGAITAVVIVAVILGYDARRTGGLLNPNVTAALILQGALHLPVWWLFILAGIALPMTTSRGALASFVAALVGLRVRGWYRIALAALALAALPALIAWRPGSVVDRLEIWQDAIWMIRQRPVMGWGLGAFALHAPRMGYWMHAHNLLLNVAVEQGVVGLALWLWWLGAVVWLLISDYRLRGESLLQAVILGYLLHQMVDVIWTVPVGMMVAANLAMMARAEVAT
jgi:O-antigen ligase